MISGVISSPSFQRNGQVSPQSLEYSLKEGSIHRRNDLVSR